MLDICLKAMQKIIKQAPVHLLNNGQSIPACGLGLYKVSDEVMYKLLSEALSVGYRHFDTAQLYKNEAAVGKGFKQIFQEGKCKRQDIFLTSKCFPHKAKTAVEALKQTLQDL